MNTLVTHILWLAACMLLVALPLRAEEIKFKHVLSLYTDEKGDGMKQPDSVACGEKSSVIVADTGNGRLLRYRVQEGAIKSVTEVRVAELSSPIMVRTNAQGELFVLDGTQRRILRLSPEGAFKGYLDPVGLPSSSSVIPRSFAVDRNGDIYVLDILSGRVLVLSPEGNYRREIKFPEPYGFFSDLALNPNGAVLILDSVSAMLFSATKDATRFSPLTKGMKTILNFPSAVAADSRGMIYLVDRNGGTVAVLRQDGSVAGRYLSKGWKEGFLNYPSHLCITEQGELFIADRGNNRVQMFLIAQ